MLPAQRDIGMKILLSIIFVVCVQACAFEGGQTIDDNCSQCEKLEGSDKHQRMIEKIEQFSIDNLDSKNAQIDFYSIEMEIEINFARCNFFVSSNFGQFVSSLEDNVFVPHVVFEALQDLHDPIPKYRAFDFYEDDALRIYDIALDSQIHSELLTGTCPTDNTKTDHTIDIRFDTGMTGMFSESNHLCNQGKSKELLDIFIEQVTNDDLFSCNNINSMD